MNANTVSFREIQKFQNGLGFSAKRTAAARIIDHETEGQLIFRLYGEEEPAATGQRRYCPAA
jgi:hypothetical protein